MRALAASAKLVIDTRNACARARDHRRQRREGLTCAILVTGTAGFIGFHVAKLLIARRAYGLSASMA